MQASSKNTLVKLLPRRFIPNSQLTFVSGIQYKTSFIPSKPSAMYQRTTGSLVSLTFSYNESTGETTVSIPSALSNNIYADYPLYFSTKTVVYDNDNPVTSSGSIQCWEPRIRNNFSINQSVKDQLQGVLTISSATLSLINEDFYLNRFMTRYDNYFNSPFQSYVVIGDNKYYLSNGIVSKVSAGKSLKFLLKSTNKLFDASATLANDKKYYQINKNDWPSTLTSADGQVIPYTAGFQTIQPPIIETIGTNAATYRPKIDINQLPLGYYRGSNQFILGTATNPFANQNLISVSEVSRFVDADGTSVTRIQLSANDIKYFIPGQELSGRYNTLVIWSGFDAKKVDYINNTIDINSQPGGVTFAQLYLQPAWVYIKTTNDNGWRAVDADPGSPFEFLLETTTNGDKLVVFKQKVLSGDWSQWQVRYVINNSTGLNQTTFAQKLINSIGLTVNASQFTTAQTQANNKVMMNIPAVGSKKIESIASYLQQIASSNNGIIFINDQTNQVGYKIINSSLSGIDFTITSTDILEPELVPTIEYDDTSSIITGSNPAFQRPEYLASSRVTLQSTFSSTFNRRTKIYEYELYNESLTGAVTERFNRLKEPSYFYSFSLKPDNYFLMQVGQIVRINDVDNKLISNQLFVDLIIVSITKSAELIEVTGYEFSRIS